MRFPILIFHITGGVLAMFAGAGAMLFRKGSERHRLAGNVFVVCMLGMATAASYLAFKKHQTGNFFGGMLAIYMVGTAWSAGRRTQSAPGILNWSGFLFALAIGILSVVHGIAKVAGSASDDGVPGGVDIFMGSVMLLAAAGDLRVFIRGISSAARVSRHLWRMCFGWFIATGSFFLGQQQVFPSALRRSGLLIVPALLPLVLLIFWLVRVRLKPARPIRNETDGVEMPA